MILLNAGKPLRPHQKSLCQACSDGICRIGAWRSRQRLNSISFFKYYISNLASYQSYFVFLRMSVPFIFLFRPSSRLFISFISLFATDRECECHRVFGHFPFQLFVYFLFLNKKTSYLKPLCRWRAEMRARQLRELSFVTNQYIRSTTDGA